MSLRHTSLTSAVAYSECARSQLESEVPCHGARHTRAEGAHRTRARRRLSRREVVPSARRTNRNRVAASSRDRSLLARDVVVERQACHAHRIVDPNNPDLRNVHVVERHAQSASHLVAKDDIADVVTVHIGELHHPPIRSREVRGQPDLEIRCPIRFWTSSVGDREAPWAFFQSRSGSL